jgi:hypothetical protein
LGGGGCGVVGGGGCLGGGGGRGGEMTQALYAHMNNKTIKWKQNKTKQKQIKGHKGQVKF